MKVVFTLLSALFLSGLSAQTLYDNVEDVRLNTYGLNIPFPDQLGNGIGGTEWPGWHGVLIQYTANPFPDPGNESSSVLAYSRNPAEVYDVLIVNCGPLADLTDYVAGTKTFTMDVWSPIPGTVFQVTLENADLAAGGYPEGRHSEYQATSTTGAAWETVTFELTGEPWSEEANNGWWPDAETAHNGADQYVILINPGVQGGETYYLDNIYGPELATEPCTEETDPLIINDGDCQQNWWHIEYVDGRMSLFNDPAEDDHCIEYARNGGAMDDVIVGNFGGALPLGDNPKIFMDVYDLGAPTTVFLSIQDNGGNELAGAEVLSDESNTWQTFEMDFSAISNFPNATNFVILVDAGQLVPKTVYFDNIRLENEVSVNELTAEDMRIFPNPATDVITVAGLTGNGSWEILDALGRKVLEGSETFTGSIHISVEGLPVGMYSVNAIVEGRMISKTLVKS